MRQYFLLFIPVSLVLTGLLWLLSPVLAGVLLVPLLVIYTIGIYDILQRSHSVLRLYPVLGHFRYMLEGVRPEIQQYFVESETSGMPVHREFRSLIYQRAKGDRDTRPFGTVFDVDRAGYEWVNHSINPRHATDQHPRVKFGGERCRQPYMASPLNISAMSYGSLSRNAIMALNLGAKLGGFSHNTGEGSISPWHLQHGGDLVWQIGTGYFGCRDAAGNFNAEQFRENAVRPEVKMIEIKLSQGAKPGHGGILPAAKLTTEIAAIRGVPMGQDVISPPGHSAFNSPRGLLDFVAQLRELSDGKPIGFKLCIGRRDEFLGICKAMLETGILPDFITIDGGEGGTGAAPTEMTNSVGTPIKDALIFVNNALIGCDIRDRMRLIAAGKMFSAFHILRAMALGADTVNAARGMMLALGCIQSRTCNTGHCPTGIATQNASRNEAIVVDDKAKRVESYHRETVKNLAELVAAAGLEHILELKPRHINRRVDGTDVRTYEQLYPSIGAGVLLSADTLPEAWQADWHAASADRW